MGRAAAQREAGSYGAARRQLTALLRRTSRNTIQQAAVLNQLGILGKATGEFAKAHRYYLRALPIVRRFPRNPYVELADLYHNLGGLAHARGHFAAGESLSRKAITLRTRRHGARAIVTWLDRTAHAALLDGLGRYAEAARVYRAALDVFRRHYGPGHYEVAVTLNNLGCNCARRGRRTDAIRYLRRSLVIKTRLFGGRSAETALTKRNLAKVLSS